MVIVIGGLGKTALRPRRSLLPRIDLQSLKKSQAKYWDTRNVELVIRTSVVDSKTGAPTIAAVYVW
jgi:hypothetical protein